MKTLIVILGVLASSCQPNEQDPRVFHLGKWTAAEAQRIAAMPSANRLDTNNNVWRATFAKDGDVYQVLLQYQSMGSFLSSYQLCVFDKRGRMIEYNSIDVPEDITPQRVVSINPTTVKFIDLVADRGKFIRGPTQTTEAYIRMCHDAQLGAPAALSNEIAKIDTRIAELQSIIASNATLLATSTNTVAIHAWRTQEATNRYNLGVHHKIREALVNQRILEVGSSGAPTMQSNLSDPHDVPREPER